MAEVSETLQYKGFMKGKDSFFSSTVLVFPPRAGVPQIF